MLELIKKIHKVIGRRYKSIVTPIILSCVDSILHMMMFWIMVQCIIELSQNTFTPVLLFRFAIILIVVFIVRSVISSINYTHTQYRGAEITKDLRLTIGNHIRSLNLGYFEKNNIGNMTSILSTDITDFEHILTHSLTTFFKIIFVTIIALFFTFSISWKYAIILMAIILLALPLIGQGGKVANKYSGKSRMAINQVISSIIEYINGIKTFKLYNLTGDKFQKLDRSFINLKRQSILTEFIIAIFVIVFSTITSLIVPISLVIGTIMFQRGELTSEYFITIIMISISVSTMMTSLGSLYPEMSYMGRAADNIIALMREKPLPYTIDEAEFDKCNIVFEKVNFGYTKNIDILHNINFIAKSNQTTALIGPSGGGKTTIISLIGRFWDIGSGNIKINDRNINEIASDALTKNISIVFQDVYLFNDTIANNIKIGKPNATIAEIEKACKAARCHDFIIELENGYDTIVGEGGSTISGGEKQRISIARALIKDAPIILLDETTSNLDVDNELEINKALDTLIKNKTVIVISHRLNTIKNANNIIVLDKGCIKEQGNHKELLKSGGWYAKMIEEQEKAQNWII